MIIFKSAAAMILALVALPEPALADPGPIGTWVMSNGKVTVSVTPCGSELCGKIVRLKEPISKIDGKPKVDRENPNPALRRRPLIGLSILIGMKPVGAGQWRGAIYNPDDGKTYRANVTLDGNTMKVQGCVLGILCKTNDFVRTN
jgi:uncharacterized protein (DUF2147 family)